MSAGVMVTTGLAVFSGMFTEVLEGVTVGTSLTSRTLTVRLASVENTGLTPLSLVIILRICCPWVSWLRGTPVVLTLPSATDSGCE
jgi:hypothetical protein